MPSIAVSLCLTLPWLNPFSFGPTTALVQWLVTLTSLAFVLLWSAQVRLAQVTQVTAGAWLAAALISATLGVLQYFGATGALTPWVNHTEIGEAFANLRQRNQFATLTNIGLAALLWWRVQDRLSLSPHWRWAGALAAALLAIGNAASSSRTGLLQLLLLLGLAWGWQRSGGPRRSDLRPLLLATALTYLMAVFALPLLGGLDPRATGIVARLQEVSPICTSRLTLWDNVLHLIAQKPWLGWGWGELSYAHFITLYPGERFCEILDNAHNLPLHLAVELGLPLALLVCALAVWLVLRARPWREADPTRQLAWSVLAMIALHSMLEYPLWYGPFLLASVLSICLLWRRSSRLAGKNSYFWPATSAWPVWTTIFLLALVAYAGWDYHRVSQIYLPPTLRSPAYRSNTLDKIADSRLFANQVRFAELTTTELTPANAHQVHELALNMLHFSPEARVAEKLIESATLLGLPDEALYYLVRYRAAFPDSHASWAREQALKSALQ